MGVIYGQNDRIERYALFEEIKHTLGSINKPILLMGDFNVVLHVEERIGTFRCNRSMREFSEWITDLNLIDIPLHGMKFTWKRNESKIPLKSWRKEHFDLMDNKISELESAIHDLDKIADVRDLNDMERARLNAANCLLNQWLIKRERVWRQRARSYGFNMKDHNTKFFHASTIYKKKKEKRDSPDIHRWQESTGCRKISNLKSETTLHIDLNKSKPRPLISIWITIRNYRQYKKNSWKLSRQERK